MIKYIQISTLFLMLVFCTSCGGQDKTDLPKDTVKAATKDTVTSQVPNSMVRNVKQDRNGNILVASYKGVFRYDPKRAVGKSFANLTSTIPSPSFWDVLEDRKGNLWFASRDSGVYFYNPSAERRSDPLRAGGKYFQHFTTREGLADNMVFSIYEDKAGNIWFGGGGLSRYDPKRAGGKSFQNFTMKDGLPQNGGRAMMEDKTGKLWIGTEGGPCFYDGKTFTVLKNKDGKAFKNVWSIIEDKKGSIWFGDVDGLWRYDPSAALRAGGRTFTKVSQRGASAIMEDKKGNIWTTGEEKPNGVWTWKLLRYDQKSLYNKEPTVTEIMSTEKMLCGILEAKDGSIWFGSLNGVYRYDPTRRSDSASLRAGGKIITDFKSAATQQ